MANIFLCLDFEKNLKLWLVSHNLIVHRRESHLDYTNVHIHLSVWWGRRPLLQHVHSIPHRPNAQNKRALIQFHSSESFCADVLEHGLMAYARFKYEIHVNLCTWGPSSWDSRGWYKWMGGIIKTQTSNSDFRRPQNSIQPGNIINRQKKIHSQTRSEVTKGQHCQAVFVIVILPCLQLHLFRAAMCCLGD